jgi:hypothetical protein
MGRGEANRRYSRTTLEIRNTPLTNVTPLLIKALRMSFASVFLAQDEPERCVGGAPQEAFKARLA